MVCRFACFSRSEHLAFKLFFLLLFHQTGAVLPNIPAYPCPNYFLCFLVTKLENSFLRQKNAIRKKLKTRKNHNISCVSIAFLILNYWWTCFVFGDCYTNWKQVCRITFYSYNLVRKVCQIFKKFRSSQWI